MVTLNPRGGEPCGYTPNPLRVARFLEALAEFSINLPLIARGAVTINIRTLGFLRLYNDTAQSVHDGPRQN